MQVKRHGEAVTVSQQPLEPVDTPLSRRLHSHETRLVSLATNFLSWLALLAGFITVGSIVYVVILGYTPMAFWDQWAELSVLAERVPPLRWFWEPHNEHRILVPKLFLMADYYLFHAKQKFLLASILAIQLAFLGLLSWSFRKFGHMRGAIWRTAVGVTACFVFHPNQIENFGQGFQITFILQNFLTALSFVALLISAQHRGDVNTPGHRVRWNWLALSVFLAAAAMYSLAAGIVAWPVLLITAAALRMPRKAIAVIFIAACAFIASFLFHHQSLDGHASPFHALRHPLTMAEYVATYFGATFFDQQLRKDLWSGVLGLVLSVILVPPALRTRSPLAVYLAMLSAQCVGTAILTSLGRLDSGIMEAAAGRYQTVAVVFWLTPAILILYAASSSRHTFFAPAAQLLLLLVAATSLAEVRPAEQHAMEQLRRDGTVAASLAAGVYDTKVVLTTFPVAQVVLETIPLLERNHWSVFDTPEFTNVGKRFAAVYGSTSDIACLGAVNTLAPAGTPGHHGLHFAGWAVERSTMRAPRAIVPTVNGIVAGAGIIGIFRPEIKQTFKTRSGSIGWEAFIHDVPPSSPITFYGISRNHHVCVAATTTAP
jgi:hypothetical protein